MYDMRSSIKNCKTYLWILLKQNVQQRCNTLTSHLLGYKVNDIDLFGTVLLFFPIQSSGRQPTCNDALRQISLLSFQYNIKYLVARNRHTNVPELQLLSTDNFKTPCQMTICFSSPIHLSVSACTSNFKGILRNNFTLHA